MYWSAFSKRPAGRPNGANKRTGLVRLDGRVFVDDGGPFLDFCASWFTAAWAYRHDRARFERTAAFLAREGATSVRALGVVGPGGWSDRTIDPHWPDYDEIIAHTTDALFSHGLRVEWTIFGSIDLAPSQADRLALVDRFIAMSKGREPAIRNWEPANEGEQNGFSGVEGRAELWRLASRIRDRTPHPVALTSPREGWIDPQTLASVNGDTPGAVLGATWLYHGSPATIGTIHLDRSTSGTGGLFRPARQAWEPQYIAGFPRAWLNNEPIGPQSSVNADDDPLRLMMSAALTYLCGGASYTLHTGPGVRFGGVEDLARGRVANFEDVAHIRETCAGIRHMLAILLPDLPNWQRHNTHPEKFPDHPFASQALLEAHNREDFLRCFAATNDRGFVVMPIDVKRSVTVPARRAMHVTSYDPLTGEVLRITERDAGDAFTFGPGSALVLKGQWR